MAKIPAVHQNTSIHHACERVILRAREIWNFNKPGGLRVCSVPSVDTTSGKIISIK